MTFVIFGMAGILFSTLGIYILKRDNAYSQNSTLVNGEVINIREQSVETSDGRRTRHLPVVKYFSQGKCWCFEGDDQGADHYLKPGSSVKIRLQNGNHKIARLEKDISGLGGIAYLFVVLGMVVVMFALIMFDPAEFQFSVVSFAPLVAILYGGVMVWPVIANARQLPVFEESVELDPSKKC